MSTKQEHAITKRGWRVGDAGYTVFGPKTDKPSPEIIATVKDKRYAHRIARCVNMHDELISALNEIWDSVPRQNERIEDFHLRLRKIAAKGFGALVHSDKGEQK